MDDAKTCFVIAPIGESNSEIRKRSDQVLKHIITPAVRECGYEPIRADQISEPGIITSQVIQHVVEDPLVIADLTDRNPNVFYELAIRHAIKRPLVQIIKKDEPLPFDVAGTRTISVDHRDLDSVDDAKKEIVNQIKTVEANSLEIDTPISVALDLQILRQSDNPEQRSLADILSAMSELRKSVSSIQQMIRDTHILETQELSERLFSRQKFNNPHVSFLYTPFGDLEKDMTPEQKETVADFVRLLRELSKTKYKPLCEYFIEPRSGKVETERIEDKNKLADDNEGNT